MKKIKLFTEEDQITILHLVGTINEFLFTEISNIYKAESNLKKICLAQTVLINALGNLTISLTSNEHGINVYKHHAKEVTRNVGTWFEVTLPEIEKQLLKDKH